MHPLKHAILALCAALLITPVTSTDDAQACGPDTDCMIGERHYRIRMPEGHDSTTPIGAIVYAHGYRGSAAGTMRNEALKKTVSDLGLALIAVKSGGEDWRLAHNPSQPTLEEQREMEYFDRVLEDVAERFPIDTKRLMATGFSAGGMVVWHLICERAEMFAGFAPMAGTFWVPTPLSCPSPAAHVIHIHGTEDPVVPLTGRSIRNSRQGDVYRVLETYRRQHDFKNPAVTEHKAIGLDCTREANETARILELCLFEGGHSFDSDYVAYAWQELERLGAFN